MHVVNECVHILRNEFSREKRDEQMNCILNATDIAGIGQSEVLFGVSYSKLCGLPLRLPYSDLPHRHIGDERALEASVQRPHEV